MKEVWKRIKGYEKYYKISNTGKIKSLRKNRLMKLQENNKGYFTIYLKNDVKKNKFFVHRLVAEHFLSKPINYNIVNHLDCNPKNNNVENLEWTNAKGNSEYMCKLGRNKRTTEWKKRLKESLIKNMGKRVIAEGIYSKQIIRFESINSVKEFGFQPSCVSNCCNNKRRQHLGYFWRFENEKI